MRVLLTFLSVLFLAACGTDAFAPNEAMAAEPTVVANESLASASESPAPKTLNDAANGGNTPLQCAKNEDCVVKDVGSCCGYNPQCVHKDQATDPAAVKAQCEKEGRRGICGFTEPAGCECVQSQCKTIPANIQIQ